MNIAEGTLLVVTFDEYDDYCVSGVYKVCREFNPVQELRQFKENTSYVPPREAQKQVVEHLLSTGLLEKVPAAELNVLTYPGLALFYAPTITGRYVLSQDQLTEED